MTTSPDTYSPTDPTDDSLSQPGSPWTLEGAMEDLNPPPPTWAMSPLLPPAPIAECDGPTVAPSSSIAGLPGCGLKRSRAIKVPLRLDTRQIRRHGPSSATDGASWRRNSLPTEDAWPAPPGPCPLTHDGRMPFSQPVQNTQPAPLISVSDTEDDMTCLKSRLERAPSVMGEHGHDVVFGYTSMADARENSHSDLLVALGVADPTPESLSAVGGQLDSVPSPPMPRAPTCAMCSPDSLLRMADHVQHATRSSSPSPLSVLCKGYMDMHAQAAHTISTPRPNMHQIEELMQDLYIEWRVLQS